MRNRPNSTSGPFGLCRAWPGKKQGEGRGIRALKSYPASSGPNNCGFVWDRGGGADWAYPSGTSRELTGEERTKSIIQQETSVSLDANSFLVLPNPVAKQEMVVGVVKPVEILRKQNELEIFSEETPDIYLKKRA